MYKALFLALTLILGLLLTTPEAHAVNVCANIFKVFKKEQVKGLESPDLLSKISSEELVTRVKAAGVPAFMKKTAHGDLPVIMVNGETTSKLQELLEKSFGTAVHLQPDWHNDHGSLRVGKWLMDVDTPGARGYGEINNTGIAWMNIDSYVKHSSKNIVETAFLLNLEELKTAQYYQAIRRSALFRVPFTFNNNNQMEAPNMLKAGEHCFVFSKGTGVSGFVSEIKGRLKQLGTSAEILTSNESLQIILKQTREQVLAIDPANEAKMSENGVLAISQPLIEALTKEGIPADKATEVARWLISYDATAAYQELMGALEITGGSGFQDMNSSRARFILIFETPDKAESFTHATYTTKGIFNTWGGDSQKPLSY